MRTPSQISLKLATLLSFVGLFVAFAPISASADEAFLVSVAGGAPALDRVDISVAPNTTLALDAGFYEVSDGVAPEARRDPDGSQYEWQVECPKKPLARCASGAFPLSGHGRTFLVPGDFQVIRILVTHLQPSQESNRGEFVLTNPAHPPEIPDSKPAALYPKNSAVPGAEPEGTPGKRHNWSGRRNHSNLDADSNETGGPATGGSPAVMGARGGSNDRGGYAMSSSESSDRAGGGHKPRGAGSTVDSGPSAYERYYFGSPGGSDPGPATNVRGYNRDNVVPVISCSHEPGPDGVMQIRCEDPSSKVLRVRAPVKSKAAILAERKAQEARSKRLAKAAAQKGRSPARKTEPTKWFPLSAAASLHRAMVASRK